MKAYFKFFSFIFSIILLVVANEQNIQANHLVGGELVYECLGDNQFRIDLTILRDCNSTGASFDSPASIFLRDPLTNEYITYEEKYAIPIYFEDFDTIQIPLEVPSINCIFSPPNICVSQLIYSIELTLPAREGGYEILHQRCCRNNTIVNVLNPQETGSTYNLLLPHETDNECENNSPVFNNYPPVLICSNESLSFDHSATDLDGDSLVYSFCDPLDGALPNCPGNPLLSNEGLFVGPNFCNPPGTNITDIELQVPYDFQSITWEAGFDANNPLGNTDDPLTIDAQTGLITGTPGQSGQFVVGICVSEYRNGILLGTKSRDIQINVSSCDGSNLTFESQEYNVEENNYFLTACVGEPIEFEHDGGPAYDYFWDFEGIGASPETSSERVPTVVFSNLGDFEASLSLEGSASDSCSLNTTVFITVIDCPIDTTETGIEENPTINLEFYPNPFSNHFTVEYALDHRAMVKAVVYNAMGQEIVIEQNQKAAGSHQVDYNTKLSGGLYYFALFIDDELVHSQKVMKLD